MKKQLCKTFRTMAAKLKDESYKVRTFSDKDSNLYSVPVNHYRRLKRIFTRDGVKGVELYYKKHVA